MLDSYKLKEETIKVSPSSTSVVYVPIDQSVKYVPRVVPHLHFGDEHRLKIYSSLEQLKISTVSNKVEDLICDYCFDLACIKAHSGLQSCTCQPGSRCD